MLAELNDLLEQLILLYFLLVNSFYGLVLLAAGAEMRNFRREIFRLQPSRLLGAKIYPKISILSPAHNEEATISDSVRALLNHHYPQIEVVVVDDGSKDRTLEVLREAFELFEVEPVYHQQLVNQPLVGLFYSRRFPNLRVASKKTEASRTHSIWRCKSPRANWSAWSTPTPCLKWTPCRSWFGLFWLELTWSRPEAACES